MTEQEREDAYWEQEEAREQAKRVLALQALEREAKLDKIKSLHARFLASKDMEETRRLHEETKALAARFLEGKE